MYTNYLFVNENGYHFFSKPNKGLGQILLLQSFVLRENTIKINLFFG